MYQLILNELFPFDEKYVADQMNEATLGQVCCGRYGGIRYKVFEDEVIIIAWQCNIADVQNFDVKLPTIITLHLNRNNYVTMASLFKNFKGSQGLPCSRKYLEKRLKSVIIDQEFSMNNSVFKEQTVFYCRHIYELVYGACAFYSYYHELGMDEAFVSEFTGMYAVDGKLECYDKISINKTETVTRIDFMNYANQLHYMNNGMIAKVEGLELCGYEVDDNTYLPIGSNQQICAENNNEFVMKMMKLMTPYWRSSNKRLGTTNRFYFSHLWPPTLFGLLSQAFGLSLFNKNYTYFQHIIYGLQRDMDGIPLCIGVIKDIEEGMLYFKNFSVEDIY